MTRPRTRRRRCSPGTATVSGMCDWSTTPGLRPPATPARRRPEATAWCFLNNDTIAQPGWLDALAGYADRTGAPVVGSKLLFPDGTVQHAGVVFGFQGDPLHLYAGCPADHPAVNKSRRFQSVTAACMLVRRDAFEQAGGFDTGFHNDLEDVDLCLRLGELGHEVHYCHESVLYHLESASRGQSARPSPSARVYRERWGRRVRHDELLYYLEDGLLDLVRLPPDQRRHRRRPPPPRSGADPRPHDPAAAPAQRNGAARDVRPCGGQRQARRQADAAAHAPPGREAAHRAPPRPRSPDVTGGGPRAGRARRGYRLGPLAAPATAAAGRAHRRRGSAARGRGAALPAG